MRVVVIGASGNVGTSLLECLAEEPAVASILAVARRPTSLVVGKTEWATADVASSDLAAHLRGADAVVHLAWLFQPTHNPAVTWRANVVGSRRVFRAAAEAGVPTLVYASSVGAYSPAPQGRDVDESWPTDGWPMAAYSREKAYVERILDAYEQDGAIARIVRLRPGFIFKPEAAVGQRRLFAGPFIPQRLARPELIPIVPDLPGLRFQAVHSRDVAEAYRLALLRPVHGAFNVAADPIIDVRALAEMLDAKPVRVPTAMVRAALAAAWHLHLVPASPDLFDAMLHFPTMDTSRARSELGWQPRHSAVDALRGLLDGVRSGTGMATPPLAPDTSGRMRAHDIATGVGEKP